MKKLRHAALGIGAVLVAGGVVLWMTRLPARPTLAISFLAYTNRPEQIMVRGSEPKEVTIKFFGALILVSNTSSRAITLQGEFRNDLRLLTNGIWKWPNDLAIVRLRGGARLLQAHESVPIFADLGNAGGPWWTEVSYQRTDSFDRFWRRLWTAAPASIQRSMRRFYDPFAMLRVKYVSPTDAPSVPVRIGRGNRGRAQTLDLIDAEPIDWTPPSRRSSPSLFDGGEYR